MPQQQQQYQAYHPSYAGGHHQPFIPQPTPIQQYHTRCAYRRKGVRWIGINNYGLPDPPSRENSSSRNTVHLFYEPPHLSQEAPNSRGPNRTHHPFTHLTPSQLDPATGTHDPQTGYEIPPASDINAIIPGGWHPHELALAILEGRVLANDPYTPVPMFNPPGPLTPENCESDTGVFTMADVNARGYTYDLLARAQGEGVWGIWELEDLVEIERMGRERERIRRAGTADGRGRERAGTADGRGREGDGRRDSGSPKRKTSFVGRVWNWQVNGLKKLSDRVRKMSGGGQ